MPRAKGVLFLNLDNKIRKNASMRNEKVDGTSILHDENFSLAKRADLCYTWSTTKEIDDKISLFKRKCKIMALNFK